MDGIFDSTMGSLEKGIIRTKKVHEIIAHNIANANTPGYVSKKFDDVLDKAVERRESPGVNLEEEMADQAKNSGRYTAYTKIMTAKLAILRTVISQGRK